MEECKMTNEFQLVEKRELREDCIVTGKQSQKDRKSTRLNSSHSAKSRMPSSA